ncbi:disulfide bond formation protein DsbA [Halobacteriovorax vibrionivorans]|uniref:Disulfide bond formation protein DsbA n=2 Tax=Halobacteriovoraceae TaxID=1652132 RepID=A0ABY0IBY0_9BACT|nr:disulfide bond formation protein DsbA [Halobacteriovorax vibrionivorans]TGD46642.1 disulfide bond formation protein DsbA [Halobacteriovorax sp. Y22]
MGPEDAPVTIVEFLDPECESCRAFYPYVKNVMAKYEGQVRLVVRYAAFHKNSSYAIAILEATRKQDKYWETLGVLFKSQPAWGNHHNPRPDLIWNYLPTIEGLDIEKVKEDMHDPKFMEIVKKDMEDGKKLGVRGTPTFFINGKPLKNFSYNQLELQVKEELEK